MKGLMFYLVAPIFGVFLACSSLGAQCVEGNCRNGTGTYVFPNGDRYTGTWISSRPHGKGVYQFASRERYEGEFRLGKFEGNGAMYYPDGAYYTGGWKNNLKNGYGRLVTPGGSITQGDWTEGRPPGREMPSPLVTSPAPAPADERNNLAGMRNCTAVYCRNGQGYYDYPDGSRWIGEFKDGLPFGQGVCYYAGGDRYEGMWQLNAPYGEGVMYQNGRAFGGVWVNGRLIKELDSEEVVPDNKIGIDQSRDVRIWAVIVGVGRYAAMPSLKFTDDDAYRVYSFLKSPEGGALPDEQIALLIDESATRANILNAMRRQFLRADANDVVLLYFSGHGLDGCFLPVDFDGYRNKLRHEEIKKVFLESAAKHKLCIADACHSGSLQYGLTARGPAPVSVNRYYQALEDSDGGIALLMSSKAEELSLEDHGLRQGVFTFYLLKGLKGEADTNGDQIVSIREIYKYVTPKVREYTAGAQTPTLSGLYDDGMPVALRRRAN